MLCAMKRGVGANAKPALCSQRAQKPAIRLEGECTSRRVSVAWLLVSGYLFFRFNPTLQQIWVASTMHTESVYSIYRYIMAVFPDS